MSGTVRVKLNEAEVLDIVSKDVRAVFIKFGNKVRARARNSMLPQTRELKKGRDGVWRQVWSNDTPKGEPPRVREGFIKHYINAAMSGESTVVIGPEALGRHTTSCLARLEYGDHPYMRPAFDAELPRLPQVWADVVKKG